MFEPVKISPSILSSNFLDMGREVAAITEAGADWIHVDVMDGHFVPNLTMGVPLVKALSSFSTIPLDVHLMISNPLQQLPWFLEYKPDYVTIHYEALGDASNANEEAKIAADLIHDAGVKAGIALKPDTPTSVLDSIIDIWDMVLVMSVFPGFSGQSYIEGSDERIAEVVRMAQHKNCTPLIQVDGGIGAHNAHLVSSAGADVIVAGNAVFKAKSYASAIADIRSSANSVHVAG